VKVIYEGPPAVHPGTGLELVPGEMEVEPEQGAALLEAGLVRVDKSSKAPRKKAEDVGAAS
jgi:hypothetical protein